MNLSRRWQRNETHHVASLLAERSNPNTKAKQTPANQTQRCSSKPNIEVFIKKKKKSPIHKPKPNLVSHGPQSCRRRRRCSSLIVIVVAHPVAPHRRSENVDHSASAPVLGTRCFLWPSLKVFCSFSL